MKQEFTLLQRHSPLIEKWIEALRSDKYQQCQGYLHNPHSGCFCAMGVLLDVVFDGEFTKVYEYLDIKSEYVDYIGPLDFAYKEPFRLMSLTLPEELLDSIIEQADGKFYPTLGNVVSKINDVGLTPVPFRTDEEQGFIMELGLPANRYLNLNDIADFLSTAIIYEPDENRVSVLS